MRIEISNQQRHPVNRQKLTAFAKWLNSRLQPLRPDREWEELSLVLTDDEGIVPVNRAYFGKDIPTDVISFAYDPLPGAEAGASGEVVINVARAVEVGPDHGGVDRELALYVAHGCHHLTGATDDTPDRREAMRRREEGWLDEAEAEGLLDGLAEGGEQR
jgi:probable rRNA maturation factor